MPYAVIEKKLPKALRGNINLGGVSDEGAAWVRGRVNAWEQGQRNRAMVNAGKKPGDKDLTTGLQAGHAHAEARRGAQQLMSPVGGGMTPTRHKRLTRMKALGMKRTSPAESRRLHAKPPEEGNLPSDEPRRRRVRTVRTPTGSAVATSPVPASKVVSKPAPKATEPPKKEDVSAPTEAPKPDLSERRMMSVGDDVPKRKYTGRVDSAQHLKATIEGRERTPEHIKSMIGTPKPPKPAPEPPAAPPPPNKRRRAAAAATLGTLGTAGAAGTALAVRHARKPAAGVVSHGSLAPVLGGTAAGVAAGTMLRSRKAPSEDSEELGKALLGLAEMFAKDDKPKAFANDDQLTPPEAAVGGAGVVGAAMAARNLKPVAYTPLDRRGQKVRQKLASSNKKVVKLKPKDWASIAGGRGGRVENEAYTARMADAMRRGKLPKGGTQVRVYGDTVKQVGGAHRAQAASMIGRKVRVEVVGRSQKKAPKLPAFLGRKENEGAALQRLRLHDTRNMPRRDLKRLARSYTAKAAKRNEVKSRAEDVAMSLLSSKKSKYGLGAALVGGTVLTGASQ